MPQPKPNSNSQALSSSACGCAEPSSRSAPSSTKNVNDFIGFAFLGQSALKWPGSPHWKHTHGFLSPLSGLPFRPPCLPPLPELEDGEPSGNSELVNKIKEIRDQANVKVCKRAQETQEVVVAREQLQLELVGKEKEFTCAIQEAADLADKLAGAQARADAELAKTIESEQQKQQQKQQQHLCQ